MQSRLTIVWSLLVMTAGCARTTAVAHNAAVTNHPLLRELAEEDQAYRRGAKVARTDAERAQLVLAELANGTIKTSNDQINAAIVLQHTGMTFCNGKLVSLSPDNYLIAHHLAKNAFESGNADAQYLVAQTLDRYLSLTEGYQKYGTNRFINQQTDKEEWAPIDRKTTDEERARYGVPPLATLLKQFPEQTRKASPSK